MTTPDVSQEAVEALCDEIDHWANVQNLPDYDQSVQAAAYLRALSLDNAKLRERVRESGI